jgi:uroporphyrin-III C-methyltransferase/precorrin-2 dehydrogenase/sirohydrochlorin ferrochelatase
VVDAPAISDFIMPSIVDRSPVIVAVSTGGAAPVLARQIRAAIEALLPADLGRLAEAAEALRAAVKARIPGFGERRRFWDGFFRNWRTGGLLTRDAAAGGPAGAALLDRTLAPGHVAIVGAGPGDPELLTLKALQRLQDADVIVHDRLVGPRVLDYARRDAETVYVGKAPGRHSYSQAAICALLAHHAQAGKRVVRLKGGDPFIFGRGGEERAYLLARGIAVEVVPGITAALGCAAEAGIPLTHRGAAQSVTYLTGASGGAVPDYDWQALARLAGTLVFYMGVGTAEAIAARLIEGGLAADTPVAVIENGTLAAQRTITGRLGGLGPMVRENTVGSPALLVVGAVVSHAAMAADIAPRLDAALAGAS